MQENNTEKRIIRRMKRIFHGHRIKRNTKKDTLLDYWGLVTYVKSEKSNSLLDWVFFPCLKCLSIPNY